MNAAEGGNGDDWVQRLSAGAQERDRAIAELRALLIRGLSKSLATRYGGNVHAEDIAQEAIVRILASLNTFNGRSHFTTWAMTIATRVGVSELRRKHYREVSLDSLAAGDSLVVEIQDDSAVSVENRLDRRNIMVMLKELIASELTARQREAIEAFLNGLPVEEIARRTGSNRNAVYKLIHDGRSRLKASFEKAGLMADDVAAILS